MTSGRHEGRCEGGSTRRRMSRSFLLYLVQKLETVTFERQRQYSSLFGRLEADINSKFVNYDDWVPPLSHLLDITHMTLSPKPFPFVFAYCKNWRRERPGNKAIIMLLCSLFLPQAANVSCDSDIIRTSPVRQDINDDSFVLDSSNQRRVNCCKS